MYAMEVESWGLDRIDQDDIPLNDDYNPACKLTKMPN